MNSPVDGVIDESDELIAALYQADRSLREGKGIALEQVEMDLELKWGIRRDAIGSRASDIS